MVRNNLTAGLIQDTDDVALYVKDIIILCPVIVKPISVRLFIVQENDGIIFLSLAQQGAVHHMILGCRTIYRFACADSIRIVGIRNRITIMRYRRQSSPILPGKLVAVTVGENPKPNKDVKISSNSTKAAGCMLSRPRRGYFRLGLLFTAYAPAWLKPAIE